MSCHHVVPLRGRGADIMTRAIVSVGLGLWTGWVQAAPIAWTLDANMTRFRVPVATNTEFSLTNNPFQSDSLARSASGTLYSADPVGMIWDVTNGFQIPVGPTSRMMIGDLVMGVNGLWGFSNASQELFFFGKKVPATKSEETGRRGNSYIAHIWWLTPFSFHLFLSLGPRGAAAAMPPRASSSATRR